MILITGYLVIFAFFTLIMINVYKLLIFLMYRDQLIKYKKMRTKQHTYKDSRKGL